MRNPSAMRRRGFIINLYVSTYHHSHLDEIGSNVRVNGEGGDDDPIIPPKMSRVVGNPRGGLVEVLGSTEPLDVEELGQGT